MKLSENFHLSEFVKSQTAARRGIKNDPGPDEIQALRLLCYRVLEPVRAHYGRPVVISSGYRSPALNRATGGVASSQHCKGEAADFEVPGISNVEVCRWMESKLNYDQLIAEFITEGDPNSGWIHVSYKEPYRNQELTALRKNGKIVYIQGIKY